MKIVKVCLVIVVLGAKGILFQVQSYFIDWLNLVNLASWVRFFWKLDCLVASVLTFTNPPANGPYDNRRWMHVFQPYSWIDNDQTMSRATTAVTITNKTNRWWATTLVNNKNTTKGASSLQPCIPGSVPLLDIKFGCLGEKRLGLRAVKPAPVLKNQIRNPNVRPSASTFECKCLQYCQFTQIYPFSKLKPPTFYPCFS